jgi:hypothetical protein
MFFSSDFCGLLQCVLRTLLDTFFAGGRRKTLEVTEIIAHAPYNESALIPRFQINLIITMVPASNSPLSEGWQRQRRLTGCLIHRRWPTLRPLLMFFSSDFCGLLQCVLRTLLDCESDRPVVLSLRFSLVSCKKQYRERFSIHRPKNKRAALEVTSNMCV